MTSRGLSAFDCAMAFFDAEPEAKAVIQEKDKKLFPRSEPIRRHSAEEAKEVIRQEEIKFGELLKRAEKVLRKMFPDASLITGEQLAIAYHTHGYDPVVVEEALNITLPSSVHDAYLEAMEQHKQKSKAK